MGLIGIVDKDGWPIAAIGVGFGAVIAAASILADWFLVEFARNFGN